MRFELHQSLWKGLKIEEAQKWQNWSRKGKRWWLPSSSAEPFIFSISDLWRFLIFSALIQCNIFLYRSVSFPCIFCASLTFDWSLNCAPPLPHSRPTSVVGVTVGNTKKIQGNTKRRCILYTKKIKEDTKKIQRR